MRAQEITDGLVDLLIHIVHKIDVRAEKRVEEEYMNEFKRVANKKGILYRIAEAVVDHPDEPVSKVVFPVASEKLLRDIIKEYKAKSPAFRQQVHTIMRASYSHHYRRMVPELLEILDFRSNNELYRPVIRAIQLVKDYVHSPRQYYPDHEIIPIKEVVTAKWREFVVEKEDDGTEKVNRLNYEVCVLQALRERVRVREIWVVGANRYRNPDNDLPTDFSSKRDTYYEALHQPTEADKFIEQLKEDMRKALRSLDGAMPRIRNKVKLLPGRKKTICLSPLDPQPEPRNLLGLKQEVGKRWPMTSLLDMLKEAALRTNFPELLTSVATRERLPREVLHRRLILCLYGLGTNTGFKRLPSADPGTTYSDLRYVRSRYIHKEQLRNAIAHVANAIFEARRTVNGQICHGFASGNGRHRVHLTAVYPQQSSAPDVSGARRVGSCDQNHLPISTSNQKSCVGRSMKDSMSLKIGTLPIHLSTMEKEENLLLTAWMIKRFLCLLCIFYRLAWSTRYLVILEAISRIAPVQLELALFFTRCIG